MNDMMHGIDAVTFQRARLWDAGFRPVPVFNHDAHVGSPGKQPLGAEWRANALRNPPFCAASPAVPHALNTGILADGLRAIDIDIDDPALAKEVISLALATFGEAPMRYRDGSCRVLFLYRASVGEPPKRSIIGTGNQKVEVLGAGQQFVAFGTHDTGATLRWMPKAPGDITADTLPVITEEQVTVFLLDAAPVIGAKPEQERISGSDPAPSPRGLTGDPLQIVTALASIPNPPDADWSHWNRIGMATYAASDGAEFGRAAFIAWSQKHDQYNEADTVERWNAYRKSPPTQIGAGTLFYHAKQAR